MITFDFSNPARCALRAADRPESSYAAWQQALKHDDGGRLTVRIGNPDVQRTAAASDRSGDVHLRAGQYSPVSGITSGIGENQVIQPSRRVLSVPGKPGATTVDTRNATNFIPCAHIRTPRSTQRDQAFAGGAR